MIVIKRITEWIGHTPLLQMAVRKSGWDLYVALEKYNPGGSIKDRMAYGMVRAAERSRHLQRGGTIVESSSGNTGTGLALVASELGYRFIVVVDSHASRDKIRTMKALGAEIVSVGDDRAEDSVATAEREAFAQRLSNKIDGAVLMKQHANPANASSYVDTLAQSLCRSLGRVDSLVGAVGTGGSLCGTAAGLRMQNDAVEIIGVEPVGSTVFGGMAGPYYQSGTGVPGDVELGDVIDYENIDRGVLVDDIAAFNTCRYFARTFGVLLGGSAGGVLYAAADVLRARSGTGTMVALAADGGEKYLDTIFDDDWMRARSLIDHSIELDVASVLSAAPISQKPLHAVA